MNDAKVNPVSVAYSVGDRQRTRWLHIYEALEDQLERDKGKTLNVYFHGLQDTDLDRVTAFFNDLFDSQSGITIHYNKHGITRVPSTLKYITQVPLEVAYRGETIGRDIHVLLDIRPHMWIYTHLQKNDRLIGDRVFVDLALVAGRVIGANERNEDCMAAG